MLCRSRPWVAISIRPLWPVEGSWLGLTLYEPAVESRLQARQRDCTILVFLAWLLMLADMLIHRQVLESLSVPLKSVVICSLFTHAVLLPVCWFRFLTCQDLITGRRTLYAFALVMTTAQAQLGLIKTVTDPCEFPEAWMVIVRRIVFVAAFMMSYASIFFEVSIGILCLVSSNNLMYLLKLWRCDPAKSYTGRSFDSDVRVWAVAVCGLALTGVALLLLRHKFAWSFSKQIMDEVIRRANSIYLIGKQIDSYLSTPMVPERTIAGDAALERLKQLSTETPSIHILSLSLQDQERVERIRCRRLAIIRDLSGLRWFLLHHRRSPAWALPSEAERLILDFLGHTPPTLRDEGAEFLRNAGDPFRLGAVSSMASTSSCGGSVVSRVRRHLQQG